MTTKECCEKWFYSLPAESRPGLKADFFISLTTALIVAKNIGLSINPPPLLKILGLTNLSGWIKTKYSNEKGEENLPLFNYFYFFWFTRSRS
jgi:hypothetical protein